MVGTQKSSFLTTGIEGRSERGARLRAASEPRAVVRARVARETEAIPALGVRKRALKSLVERILVAFQLGPASVEPIDFRLSIGHLFGELRQ